MAQPRDSRGRWRKSRFGAVAVTASVAIVIGDSGAAVETSAKISRSSTSSGRSAQRSEAEISTENLRSAEVKLLRHGLRVDGNVSNDGADCAEHAYGLVRDFFRRQPCTSLRRAHLTLHDRKDDVVLLAISWVKMPDRQTARAYKRLVDAPGTGNITELSREGSRYRTVRYTGLRYASRRDGLVVMNAQAEPVARGWGGIALATIVNDAIR
jgi:hypothetical protein